LLKLGTMPSTRWGENIHKALSWTGRLAASMTCILVAVALVSAKSKTDMTAVSGTVTGHVQKVGFRATIQKQAIQYNLAGSTENNTDGSVRFRLQGDNDRIKQALKVISKGPKKSSDVKIGTSPDTVAQGLDTFTIVGWTSVSRNIATPYDLVFSLRNPDSIITKGAAKAAWLKICERTVKGADVGKCDKDSDE
jgi:acylphosphatase